MTTPERCNRYLCEFLIGARKAARLTQLELAQRLGTSPASISRYERGERKLKLMEFITIAMTLDIDPAETLEAVRKVRDRDLGSLSNDGEG